MSKVTKRKHVFGEVLGEYILPEESQQIVKVAAPRGNNLHEVITPEGEKYLASMPTKFRKNVWIKRGDFVIVDPISEGDKVKGEISVILYPKQIRYIKQEGKWPVEFSDKQRSEPAALPPSQSEKHAGSEGDEEGDSEESDNDDDLFVNTNRPNVFYEESDDDSSDDDDEDNDDVGVDSYRDDSVEDDIPDTNENKDEFEETVEK